MSSHRKPTKAPVEAEKAVFTKEDTSKMKAPERPVEFIAPEGSEDWIPPERTPEERKKRAIWLTIAIVGIVAAVALIILSMTSILNGGGDKQNTRLLATPNVIDLPVTESPSPSPTASASPSPAVTPIAALNLTEEDMAQYFKAHDLYVLVGSSNIDYMYGVYVDNDVIQYVIADDSNVSPLNTGRYTLVYNLNVKREAYLSAVEKNPINTPLAGSATSTSRNTYESVRIEKTVTVLSKEDARTYIRNGETVLASDKRTASMSDVEDDPTPTPEPTATPTPTPAHEHSWLIAKMLVSPAATHEEPIYEEQIIEPAYDEEIYAFDCDNPECGERRGTEEEMNEHISNSGHESYHRVFVETIHHDAVTTTAQVGTQTVVDQEAVYEYVKFCTDPGCPNYNEEADRYRVAHPDSVQPA